MAVRQDAVALYQAVQRVRVDIQTSFVYVTISKLGESNFASAQGNGQWGESARQKKSGRTQRGNLVLREV